MSALLISGASGYLGHRLMKYLEQQQIHQKLIGIDIQEPPTAYSRAQFVKADIRHPSLLKILKTNKVDTVIHLAFINDQRFDATTAHEMNVIGTMKMLNACAVAGVKKIIVASCSLVYGARFDNPNYLVEDSPLLANRSFHYASDKIEVENLCQQFLKRHPDIILILFRSCPFIGPDCNTFMAQLFKRPLVPLILGFNPLMQLIHVDDCLAAMVHFLNHEHSDIFNLAGDGTIPLRKAIRISGGVPLPFLTTFLYPVSELLWHLKLSVSPVEQLGYLKYQCTINNQKMKDVFDFRPCYSSEGALLDFVAFQRTEHVSADQQIQNKQFTMLSDSDNDFDELN
ncbi:NAD-dependent epimerase/dehydratase family protein [candidate division CSSED10-310 bacterium]|uniref:NAD-dependent epimerase/dehydratase family protein n=1 Tax=candidate division CSSED10-310 bacterium TaxID=2855610 RepID=A0ABV6Z1N5_UNCC1